MFAVIAPAGSPKWVHDPASLFNHAEKAENRKNSTVAREFEISLPHELNNAQREKLAKDLTEKLVDRFGFAAMFAIHAPDKPDELNHHVHILATTRKMEPTGLTSKTRELDDIAKEKDEITGRRFNPAIIEVRKTVADTINLHLKSAGINQTVSHLSLLDQKNEAIERGDLVAAIQLDRKPTVHIGKNPELSEQRAQKNDSIKSDNSIRLESSVNAFEKMGQEKNPIIFQPQKKLKPLFDNPIFDVLQKPDNQTQTAAPAAPAAAGAEDGNILGLMSSIANAEQQLSAVPPGTGQQFQLRRSVIASKIDQLRKQLALAIDKKISPNNQAEPHKINSSAGSAQQQPSDVQEQRSQMKLNAMKLRQVAKVFQQQIPNAPPNKKIELMNKAARAEEAAEQLEAALSGPDHGQTKKLNGPAFRPRMI